MKVLGIIVAALIAYFLGTIPVGEWVARLYGKDDLTKTGSGNPGTTNVLRTMGWLPSLMTLAGDCLKGVLGAWLGMGLFGVWTAMQIDWAVRSLVFGVRFLGHKWEKARVLEG